MSLQYAARIPTDASGNPMEGYPAAKRPEARIASHNTTVSSVITLTDNTTVLEVTASGGDVGIRWVASTDTQASIVTLGANINYDHIVNGGDTRRFVVPIEKAGVTGSIVGANVLNGLYKRVAWISAGANASVYGAQF